MYEFSTYADCRGSAMRAVAADGIRRLIYWTGRGGAGSSVRYAHLRQGEQNNRRPSDWVFAHDVRAGDSE